MRPLIRLVIVLAAMASLLASTAAADPPLHVSIPIDQTSPSSLLSAACGFGVSIETAGTLKATVFYDRSGTMIVREIDTQPGTLITVSSATKSLSFPFASVFHFDYPNGTAPGSQAVLKITGLGDKVPRLPADAGPIEFDDATVLFVDSNGVPIVDFGAPSTSHGHSNGAFDLVTAVCTDIAP